MPRGEESAARCVARWRMIIIKENPIGKTTYASKLIELLPTSPWPFGFAFYVIWTSLIVRQNAIGHGQINIHVLYYCASGLVFLIVAIYFWFRKSDEKTLPGILFHSVALVCMLLSSCFLSLRVFDGSDLFAILGSVIGAFGACMALLAWGAYLSQLPIAKSFVYIFGSFALQFLLISNFFLFSPFGSFVILLILALGSTVCLLASMRTLPVGSTQQHDMSNQGTPSDIPVSAQNVEPSIVYYDKNTLPEFWKLLVVVIIYSFLLTLRSTISFESGTFLVFFLNALAFVTAIILFWAMMLQKSAMLFERRLQLLLLLFAVGFFLLPFSTGLIFEGIGVLFFIATGLIYMLFILATIDIAHHASVHPFVIIAAWGACYGVPRVLYYVTQSFLANHVDPSASVFALSLISMLGIVVIVALLLGDRPAGLRPIFFSLSHPADFLDRAASIDESCKQLAEQHGLTTRELEILILICNGRSKGYIADTLYISENTVKAHTKNVYAKLSVHSKEDLMKLLGDV
jgi:DNA-binding NarL/FixJ family response regulator